MGHAHAKGIVHRDLKPENVLFTAGEDSGAEGAGGGRVAPIGSGAGRPLVTDLGLAKHFSKDATGASQSVSLSRTGEMRGTVAYMAPEQLNDAKSVGPASDVFALGAILYECLAGEPAFAADSVHATFVAIAECRPRPLRKLRSDCPRWLARVVARALSPKIADRPQDGTALERELAAGPANEPPRWPLALGAVVLLGLVGGGVLVALRGGKGDAAPVASATPAAASATPTAASPAAPTPAPVADDQPRDDPRHPVTSCRELAQWVKRHPDRAEARRLLRRMESKKLASVALGAKAHVSWGGPTTLLVSSVDDKRPFVVDVDVDPPAKTPIQGFPPANLVSQAVRRRPDGTVRWVIGSEERAFIIEGDPRKPDEMSWREIHLFPGEVPANWGNSTFASMALSLDGRWAAGGCDDSIYVLDLDDRAARPRALRNEQPDGANALLFSRDGARLIACRGHGNGQPGNAVTSFDLRGGSPPTRKARVTVPRSLAPAGGDRIAYGCDEGEIVIARPDDLVEIETLSYPDAWTQEPMKVIQGLALLPGDRLLAITGDREKVDGLSRLFSRSTDPKDPVLSIAEKLDLLTSLAVSEDGRFAALGYHTPGAVEVRVIPDQP
jgi:hypothetical protein